jgi:hypothetical protein
MSPECVSKRSALRNSGSVGLCLDQRVDFRATLNAHHIVELLTEFPDFVVVSPTYSSLFDRSFTLSDKDIGQNIELRSCIVLIDVIQLTR